MKKQKKNGPKFNTSLFWSLVIFTSLSVAIAGVSVYFFNKMDQIYKINTSINNLSTQYNKANKLEANFFNKEVFDGNFYKSGQSESLLKFKLKVASIRDSIASIKRNRSFTDFGIASEVNIVEEELIRYQSIFEKAVGKSLEKGYKDFGLEGKMRAFVHELEKKSDKIGVAKVLMLRRHEKDYLLRNEPVYIEKLTMTLQELKTDILRNNDLKVSEKDDLIVLLYNYFQSFNALVHVGKEIGQREEKGLNELLTESKSGIEKHLEVLQVETLEKENALIGGLQKTYMVVSLNLIAATLLLIWLFIRYRKNNNDEANKKATEAILNVELGQFKQAQ